MHCEKCIPIIYNTSNNITFDMTFRIMFDSLLKSPGTSLMKVVQIDEGGSHFKMIFIKTKHLSLEFLYNPEDDCFNQDLYHFIKQIGIWQRI